MLYILTHRAGFNLMNIRTYKYEFETDIIFALGGANKTCSIPEDCLVDYADEFDYVNGRWMTHFLAKPLGKSKFGAAAVVPATFFQNVTEISTTSEGGNF